MFKLPNLKYDYGDLEPYIDEETMKIHHQKHHAGYLAKLNGALQSFSLSKDITLEKLMENLNEIVPQDIYWEVRNNGGGFLNHSIFFDLLTPNSTKRPIGKLKRDITKKFGSFEDFKKIFQKSALTRFASGWAWLLVDEKNRLFVKSTANQDCPISSGKKIVLGVDLWEHAYYLKYRNRRAEYIENWWNVVNWEYAEERYQKIAENF